MRHRRGWDRVWLIGHAELRRGRPKEAIEALEQALPRLSQAIDRDHEADARLVLARALTVLGRAEEAPPHLDRAQELARSLNNSKWLADALAESGRVALAQDESGPADQVRLLLLTAVARKARQDDRTTALLDEAERVARNADNGALIRLVADARKRG
jgi:tetratricopeptide (TPR) repeat protein